jgi:hypothetical protein
MRRAHKFERIALDPLSLSLPIPIHCSSGVLGSLSLDRETQHHGLPPPSDDNSELLTAFRSSIRAFIRRAESSQPSEFSIAQLLREFRFQRRRLYDVISVFRALGSCRMIAVDLI